MLTRRDLQYRLEALAEQEANRSAYDGHKPHKVALVYPNTYYVGMSNLGLHIIYEELNARPDTCCERAFMPERQEMAAYTKTRTPLMSIESRRPLHQFSIIGIDITFEMDYFNIPILLQMGQVPVLAKDRRTADVFVIGGGPCATFNPEPLADFFDAFIIGEGEEITAKAVGCINEGRERGLSRRAILKELSQLEGVYVPSLYEVTYNDETHQITRQALAGAPDTIKRHWGPLTAGGETVVATDYTEFGAMYIVEVARGCGRHCRFCMAGYCYRKPRVRPLHQLKEGVDRAALLGKKVGLMGAAISDYPAIDELVAYIRSKNLRYSCASLRADSLTSDVVKGLAVSGQHTITIAPETGSDRLRKVINKGITEDDLRTSVRMAAAGGIHQIRFYIMVGLPTEMDEDIEAIIDLAKRTRAYMEEVGCHGRLTLSINPFIPKPFTPFQWMAMDTRREVNRKLKGIRKALSKDRQIEVLIESLKEAYIQAVLARGDRRLGSVLAACAKADGSKSFVGLCQEAGIDVDQANYRERAFDEELPWDFLDMGLADGYLQAEWEKGLQGAYTAPCQDGCQRCGVCREAR